EYVFTATSSSEYVSATVGFPKYVSATVGSLEYMLAAIGSPKEEYMSNIAGSLEGEYVSSTASFPDEKYVSNTSGPLEESLPSSMIETENHIFLTQKNEYSALYSEKRFTLWEICENFINNWAKRRGFYLVKDQVTHKDGIIHQ
ncbi:25731_t:CDS:2, partial [Gigaspora margarita]